MPVARSTSSWPLSFGDSGSSSGGLSTGAKAGIGAGVSVGGILIILAIGYLIFRRRTRHKQLPAASKETSSLDEESVHPAQEKVDLSVDGGNVLPYQQMPELSSNGAGSQDAPTTSPADSMQGRCELPVPEDETVSSRYSRIGTDSDTIQSPRSPGAGSSVRHSQVELEAHQIPELAPSPLFSADLGRRSLPF